MRRYDRKIAKSCWNHDGMKKRNGMRKATKTSVKNRIKKMERER